MPDFLKWALIFNFRKLNFWGKGQEIQATRITGISYGIIQRVVTDQRTVT